MDAITLNYLALGCFSAIVVIYILLYIGYFEDMAELYFKGAPIVFFSVLTWPLIVLLGLSYVMIYLIVERPQMKADEQAEREKVSAKEEQIEEGGE